MPALFGRAAGPRQRPDRDGLWPATAGTTSMTWVARRADGEALSALLPEGFVVREPLLIAEAVSLSGLPWLAGRGYEVLVISVPVTHEGKPGRLELVTWENCPDAIITGREELGWNKLYADTMSRQETEAGMRYAASWNGTCFFRMAVELRPESAYSSGWRAGPLMHYRVFPRTGAPGELEVEQITAADGGAAPCPSCPADGNFAFLPATFAELPTLHHIVNSLAAVDLGETVDAGRAHETGWGDVRDIRVISS